MPPAAFRAAADRAAGAHGSYHPSLHLDVDPHQAIHVRLAALRTGPAPYRAGPCAATASQAADRRACALLRGRPARRARAAADRAASAWLAVVVAVAAACALQDATYCQARLSRQSGTEAHASV